MLDPRNLWVYNYTSPATSELPNGARSASYKPEANVSTTSGSLKIAANSTGETVDSYVSDNFINGKLCSSDIASVQLTADGNITVTSNVTIKSNGKVALYIVAAKGDQEYSGNIKLNNVVIEVDGGVSIGAQGNITVNNSDLTSKKNVTVGNSKQKGIVKISNSNLSGATTTVSAMNGDIDITGGRVNGTTSVKISAAATNGNATLSGVSVNTPDVNVTGSNITLDNATLNVTPTSAEQGIRIGLSPTYPANTPAKNVVIKNSTLNTTGS